MTPFLTVLIDNYNRNRTRGGLLRFPHGDSAHSFGDGVEATYFFEQFNHNYSIINGIYFYLFKTIITQ